MIVDQTPLELSFCLAYLWYADKGMCDEIGGAEFKRMLAKWETDGRPFPLTSWFRKNLNWPPNGGQVHKPPAK